MSVKGKLTQEYHAAIEKGLPSWFFVGKVNDAPKQGSYFVLDVPGEGTLRSVLDKQQHHMATEGIQTWNRQPQTMETCPEQSRR
ncbi:hypothetical protein [Actinoplanes subtropicus]|uniref:hypothetical protein n=1 Tax=Actinoplanes subtropicus TaxID=543632 RepID=UPI000AE07C56|nr:hypothetical protein [Actinoplanes subtropicus]